MPNEEEVVDGPVPWCKSNQLTFLAEQVSHHPPSEFTNCFICCFYVFLITFGRAVETPLIKINIWGRSCHSSFIAYVQQLIVRWDQSKIC